MKIGVACLGQTLEDRVSEQFGRCPFFLLVDSDSNSVEAVPNPGAIANQGAGPAAANELASHGVAVVLAGDFGPKARTALEAAGIRTIPAKGKAADALAALGD